MNKTIVGLLFTVLGLASPHCYPESDVERLSPALRMLLQQEMLAIEKGMQNIVPAFASGDLKKVAGIAENISNSYILKQNITDAQKHELHQKLPKEFILKDQKFHGYAGMLEHVSEEGYTELVGFYYSKLLESCVGCHSEHAGHRFPLMISDSDSLKKEHSH